MSDLAKKKEVDKAMHDAWVAWAAQCDKMLAYYEQEAKKAAGKDEGRAKEMTELAKAFKQARANYEKESQRARAHFSKMDKELEKMLAEK